MSTQRIPSPARYSTGFGAILPWSPVLVGVGVVIGYLIWILVVPPGDSASTAPGSVEAPPAASSPPVASAPPATPGVSPSGTVDPTASPGAIESPGVTVPPLDPSAPPLDPSAPPDDFVARYRLVTLAEHTFTSRMVLVNGADQPQSWRLVLEFSPDVGDLVEVWVDGGPEPAVDESGNRYVITGSAPIAPVSWVRLTLDFERTGDDVDPISCTVNGVPCG